MEILFIVCLGLLLLAYLFMYREPDVENGIGKAGKQVSGECIVKDREKVTAKKSIQERMIVQEEDDPRPVGPEEEAMAILAEMSLEEKVAQMFFVTPEMLTGISTVTAAGSATEEALEQYPVGGIVYFASNLQNPEQTGEMLGHTQEYMTEKYGIPIFLGIDEEGGRVARIGRNENFEVERVPAMGEVAKNGGEEAVYGAAQTIGSYLRELGFNVDFAPDADVLTNRDNQVIGDRSFGTDAAQVAECASQFAEGLHSEGILAAYKHFPGHGGTREDSHTGYAYSYGTMEDMETADLVPFLRGCEQEVDFIMVSHISTPQITEDNVPASLSSFWITDILREEMGYQGIIITDSLSMGAIVSNYDSEEAVLLATEAGCDMILMPADFKRDYKALLDQVMEGSIPEERIDESVLRILQAKMRLLNGGR